MLLDSGAKFPVVHATTRPRACAHRESDAGVASKEARDGAVSTGMTDGMEMGYARLDEMFKKNAA